jgi:hypothetical protein
MPSNPNAGLKVKSSMGFVRLTPSAHMQVITQFVNFDIDFDDLGFAPPFDAKLVRLVVRWLVKLVNTKSIEHKSSSLVVNIPSRFDLLIQFQYISISYLYPLVLVAID